MRSKRCDARGARQNATCKMKNEKWKNQEVRSKKKIQDRKK